ncbi:MAG: SIMPL domain-containing protein [Candidatus Heimdallarchaeota archaeon]
MQKMNSPTGAAMVLIAAIAIVTGVWALNNYFAVSDIYQPDPGKLIGAAPAQTDGLNQIVVEGIGMVRLDPDQAMLSLGVTTQAETATKAIQDNAAKMSQVVDMMKAQGIAENDLQTSRFSLWTVYDKEFTVPISYRVSNQITVTTKEIDKVGQLIDSAVLAGANQVNSVSFTMSEEAIAQIRLQALALAIEDAQARAKAIANKLDLTIVGVGYVSESTGYSPYYADTRAVAAYEEVSTPIEPGEVTFTASVHIIFLFE